ncbi:MAG: ABC transporter ATP-binding protein [bacterium]
MGNQLTLKNVSKNFGDFVAVDKVSIDIEHGEFLTFLGPSGSGKTTTLNMIAGFEIPSSGEILLEEQDITTVPPNKRGIGMVFQNYALFPHMTVINNIAFPLKMRKTPTDQIKKMTHEVLELVKLPGFGERFPNQLSGGQQQRVALARALVFNPQILLMDEPLGALDKKLRDHMRLEIKHLQKKLNITVIYVTHDQEEALTMSDRIAIMNNGRIVQLDTPETLYSTPAELFVSNFIGESNTLAGKTVSSDGDLMRIETSQGLSILARRGGKTNPDKEVAVAVRPEKIQIFLEPQDKPDDIDNFFEGRIEETVYIGDANIYRVHLIGEMFVDVKIQSTPSIHVYKPGETVTVGWHSRHCLALN